MLILISDLHLMDDTAGAHHLEPLAVHRAFWELALRTREARTTDLSIVLVGDIFDLIRTERWFDVPLAERPWGERPSEAAALRIFEGIVEHNAQTFEILKGTHDEEFGFPVKPKRVFIPGNHDRLCNLYPSLRRRVRECLGMEPTDEPFDHDYIDVDHALFARHGQEWDSHNFEPVSDPAARRGLHLPLEDYLQTSIGDIMASELASRLPGAVRDHLPRNHPQRESIYEKFGELFDVRPLVAIVQWLAYEIGGFDAAVRRAVDEARRDTARIVRTLPFVQEWLEKHDRPMDPFDHSDRVRLLLRMLERRGRYGVEPVLKRISKSVREPGSHYSRRAADDFVRLDRHADLRDAILYVAYGHTHMPVQRPIEVVQQNGRQRDRIYLNTGTWRPHMIPSPTHRGFARFDNLDFTLIYKPGERMWGEHVSGWASFEAWAGTFKDNSECRYPL